MKKTELLYNLLLVPVDFVALVLAALLGYHLRFNTELFPAFQPKGHDVDFASYVTVVVIMALFFMFVMAMARLYVLGNNRRLYQELIRVSAAISAATLALILYIFFTRDIEASRFLVVVDWALAIIFVGFERTFLRYIQHLLLRRGIGVEKIVLIGQNEVSTKLSDTFAAHPDWGIRVAHDLPAAHIESLLQQLAQSYNAAHFDGVILASQDFPPVEMLKIRNWCFGKHLSFQFAPNLLELQVNNITTQAIAGIPLIELQQTKLSGWGHVAKRLTDIIGATVAIILTSPLLLLTALAVKIDSPGGPVIYRNKRINHKGEEFSVYKFRSMKPEYCTGVNYGRKDAIEYEKKLIAAQSARKGPLYKVVNDPRYTRVGPFIRKTSLDELPQFFNVLFGSMSLVGPRPHQEREIEKYQEHHKRVFAVKPGVTGLPQISGRSDLDFEDEVRLDTYYIENWSLFLDLRILFLTPFSIFKKRETI